MQREKDIIFLLCGVLFAKTYRRELISQEVDLLRARRKRRGEKKEKRKKENERKKRKTTKRREAPTYGSNLLLE